jgi:hypothetical protein
MQTRSLAGFRINGAVKLVDDFSIFPFYCTDAGNGRIGPGTVGLQI